MSIYINTILNSLFLFSFIALLISFPLFIYEYRKYGSFIPFRMLITYSFSFYLLTAYFTVILPLPAISEVAASTGPRAQLIPFTFLREFLSETVFHITDPSTWLPAAKQFVFLQPFFNILLLLPLGIYLRYYFECSLKKTVLFSFLFSLFFELTQLSGLYGIYPRPYRLFDVDDLMLNTLGGLLGYVIAPLFMFFLPSREELLKKSVKQAKTVGFFRRLTAFIIDFFLLSLLSSVLQRLFSLLFAETSSLPMILSYIVSVFLYLIVFSFLSYGRTLGMMVVRIKVTDNQGQRPTLRALLLRNGVLYYLIFPMYFFLLFLLNLTGTIPEQHLHALLVVILVVMVPCFFLLLYLLFCIVFRRHIFFYEKASKTKYMSTYEKHTAPEAAKKK